MTDRETHLLRCLDRALLHGGDTHTIADVVPMLYDGRAQWWQHGDGCAITEIQQTPRIRVLNCWLVAGNLRDCVALQPEIEDWAKRQGVRRVTATGRRGWAPITERMGFEVAGIALRRDLI